MLKPYNESDARNCLFLEDLTLQPGVEEQPALSSIAHKLLQSHLANATEARPHHESPMRRSERSDIDFNKEWRPYTEEVDLENIKGVDEHNAASYNSHPLVSA